MESRIHGDMYVRFGGRLAETYNRSLLKEIADFCGIKKNLTTHAARHTFATTVTLANNVPLQEVSAMLGHASTRMTQHYARVMDRNLKDNMNIVRSKMGL